MKNKKVFASVLLTLVIVTTIVPQLAYAGLLDTVIGGILKGVGMLEVALTGVPTALTGSLLKWAVGPAINVPYTPLKPGNDVVTLGWKAMRDFANMIIVLGFVVVGIATILRMREYEAQKLLWPLIIAAILVNFSALICGLVIDASNITTKYFLGVQSGTSVTDKFQISSQIGTIWNMDNGNWKGIIATAIGFCAANVVGFVVFGLLFFLFMARYAMLWMLVIFSPLAFVLGVFPATKRYAETWWTEFLKWCVVGTPAAITLWLAGVAAGGGLKMTPSGDPGVGEASGQVMTLIASALMPAIIMLAGFLFTLKISGAGAAIAIGAAATVGGWAMGAVKGAGKLAMNRVKNTGAMQKMTNKVGGAMERVGISPAGSTASRQAKTNKEQQGNLEKLSSDRLGGIATGKGFYTPRERANAAAVLATRGDLHTIPQGKLPGIAAKAQGFGIDRKDLEKADPRLAMSDTAKPSAADLKAISGRVSGMSHQDINKKIGTGSYSIQSLAAMSSQKDAKGRSQFTQAWSGANPKQKAAWKEILTDPAKNQEAKSYISHLQTLKAQGSPEATTHLANLQQNMKYVRTSGKVVKKSTQAPTQGATQGATPRKLSSVGYRPVPTGGGGTQPSKKAPKKPSVKPASPPPPPKTTPNTP